MFGSAMLDVAIGMIFVYLLLSLISSAIKEGIESWVKKRAIDLEKGVRELLNDHTGTGLAKQLFNHPFISSLYKGSYEPPGKLSLLTGTKLPSYIPASN